MAVGVQRRLDFFMTETILKQFRRDVHLDQGRHVAMTNVVHAYALHTGSVASGFELIIEEVLRVRKEAVVRLKAVALIDILSEADLEGFGNGDNTIAFRRFRRRDDVPCSNQS